MRVWLANPRGFCAGVERAIEIVERTLESHGAPVYVRHEIVHNERVVADLARKGAVFVQDTDQVPIGATVVFSAHGVPRSVERAAAQRRLDVADATCPLVQKVHREARRHAAAGLDLVVVGHADHVEVIGTVGQVSTATHVVDSVEAVTSLEVADPERLAYVTQTTLSVTDTRAIVDALEARFPAIRGAATRDICYATQNRQAAAEDLARRCRLVVVIGSRRSSNSARLREVVAATGTPAVQVADASELVREWFAGVGDLGLTSGASTPDVLVREVLARLGEWFPLDLRELAGRTEEVVLPLPARFTRARSVGEVRA
jgi:4-hydroxy-3-methylbut-2-enyl diphosphate reductase